MENSTTLSDYRYHAFLSFRGEDTRKAFTDHLYAAFQRAGIHTFRDDDEIKRGANIARELQKAIQESPVSIIVFSKGYACSRWCLNELARIMKQRESNNGHLVLPVFYDVDPSDVRKQSGSFAEAFAKHGKEQQVYKVNEWRRALSDAADLGGMVLGDQYESQFIQNIIDEIWKMLDHATILNIDSMIGIRYRVRHLNQWLRDGSNDVDVAVICGMGGIGKTTVAQFAYDLNCYRFPGSSFLHVGSTVEPNSVLNVQRKLLLDIQRGREPEAVGISSTASDGRSKIKHVVCWNRMLIVLDDVQHPYQFNAILGKREWFYPGSKIIITTRDKNLLKAQEIIPHVVFEVEEFDERETLEFFYQRAFGEAHPLDYNKELLVQCWKGFSFALITVGSHRRGEPFGNT